MSRRSTPAQPAASIKAQNSAAIGPRLFCLHSAARMNECRIQESDLHESCHDRFSRDLLIAKSTSSHGTEPTTISFTGRTKGEDHRVHEIELRRSRLGRDLH